MFSTFDLASIASWEGDLVSINPAFLAPSINSSPFLSLISMNVQPSLAPQLPQAIFAFLGILTSHR